VQAAVVSGGSPTFSTHIKRNVECSPGTFVFWDWGYKHQFPDQPFEYAALVITRVISIVNDKQITTDLGYKAVSSENPLPRVHFLNAPDANPVSQSEEHLCLEVPDSSKYILGDVLFGVPVHICPTIALYDRAWVVENNEINDSWKVTARARSINY
jgi:D-serine deaminase-like pyridoxal phosphate-dependent protein